MIFLLWQPWQTNTGMDALSVPSYLWFSGAGLLCMEWASSSIQAAGHGEHKLDLQKIKTGPLQVRKCARCTKALCPWIKKMVQYCWRPGDKSLSRSFPWVQTTLTWTSHLCLQCPAIIMDHLHHPPECSCWKLVGSTFCAWCSEISQWCMSVFTLCAKYLVSLSAAQLTSCHYGPFFLVILLMASSHLCSFSLSETTY